MSRLEEIEKKLFNGFSVWDMSEDDWMYLYKQAERVKELEYASKYNGELNEFLQKRKLPPDTLGRHVVDVVMEYVEELENLRRGDLANATNKH